MDVENREVKKVIKTNVNCPELRESLSLYSIIGQNRIVEILKNVVLSYYNDKEAQRSPQLPSIIFSGPSSGLGRYTIAKALINSLCLSDYRGSLGRSLGQGGTGFVDLLDNSTDNTTLIVIGAEHLSRYAQEVFYDILTKGRVSVPDRISHTNVEIEFEKRPLIIFICQHTATIFPELLQKFDFRLTLTKFSPKEIFLILKQRCTYCNFKYQHDNLLKMIAENSNGNPGESMKLLQMTYINSRAKDKEVIEMGDVERAVGLLGGEKSKGE